MSGVGDVFEPLESLLCEFNELCGSCESVCGVVNVCNREKYERGREVILFAASVVVFVEVQCTFSSKNEQILVS